MIYLRLYFISNHWKCVISADNSEYDGHEAHSLPSLDVQHHFNFNEGLITIR